MPAAATTTAAGATAATTTATTTATTATTTATTAMKPLAPATIMPTTAAATPSLVAKPLPRAVAEPPPRATASALGDTLARAWRRRRLWDLPHPAFCPLVGVCLPMPTLRRLLARCVVEARDEDDYALHCRAIADGQQRGPVAEAMQRELDRRYAASLRQAAALKTREALAAWWQDASRDDRVAGALWAALTHPRCDGALEDQVLHDIHMLQHQLGVAGPRGPAPPGRPG